MVCRHVIVINYGYYCSADLRSIWPTGCLQNQGCQPQRGSSCCLARLVAKKPAAARAARAYPCHGQLTRQRACGANEPVGKWWLGCLQTLPAACWQRWETRESVGKGATCLEESSHAGVSGRAGHKTGKGFRGFSSGSFAETCPFISLECLGTLEGFYVAFLEVGEDFGIFRGSPSSLLCCLFASSV